MTTVMMAVEKRNKFLLLSLWYLAGALWFLSYGYTEMAGSDLWWHLASGREIIEQGTLWLRDDWSFSANGERWRNHEWLADLIYWGWYRLFGLQALVYWKWLILVASYSGLQLLLYRLTRNHPASLLLAVVAMAVGAPFLDVRPHLYSLLCTVIMLHLVVSRAGFWSFALLFLVWVNLHGGFIYGLLTLPLLLFPYRHFSWLALRQVAWLYLGCVAVCLLNPDGVKVVLMPLVYALQADSPFRQIAEWLPIWRPGGIRAPLFYGSISLLPLSLAGYLLLARYRCGSVPWPWLLLVLFTLAMALTSRRFIPLFALTLAVFCAPLAAYGLRWLNGRTRWNVLLGGVLLLVGLLRLAPYPIAAAPAFHYLTAQYSYPEYMVDVIQANNLKGNVFAYYNWGGYLHWRTDGALRVFIDGRANTLYSDQTYLDYVNVLARRPHWQEVLANSGARYLLWPRHRAGGMIRANILEQSGKWRMLLQTETAIFMERNDGLPVIHMQLPTANVLAIQLELAARALAMGVYPMAVQKAQAVLDVQPWQYRACHIRFRALLQMKAESDAREAQAACQRQFPSDYLR
ncbi:MAG: hypothetical protein ACK5ME_12975 [Parahaliea sp.]